jgi:hypothetical protein
MNDWTHGYPIEQLKTYAGVFKNAHKPLVFGAFGLVKERDIAQALIDNRLVQAGFPAQALAIISCSKRPSRREDFAKREYVVPVGALQIKALAGTSVAMTCKVVETCISDAAGAPIWAEIFQEDPIARETMAHTGFSYVTTKIAAGSEIKGIYLHGADIPLSTLNAAERATLEILEEQFLEKDDLAEISGECRRFDKYWSQHYSSYNKRKSWTSFALRGYSDDTSFIIKPAEMSKSWKEENAATLKERPRWTAAAEHFPATVQAAKRLTDNLDRVRFMRLRAKDGELSRHANITDYEAGVADDCVTRLHVPIHTSDAISFFSWDALGHKIERKLPEGCLAYLDQRKPHAVKNTDPTLDRIHLVVDCFSNAALRKMVGDAFTKNNQ